MEGSRKLGEAVFVREASTARASPFEILRSLVYSIVYSQSYCRRHFEIRMNSAWVFYINLYSLSSRASTRLLPLQTRVKKLHEKMSACVTKFEISCGKNEKKEEETSVCTIGHLCFNKTFLFSVLPFSLLTTT